MKIWDVDSFFESRWGCNWYPAYDKLGHFTFHLLAISICGQFINIWTAFVIWQGIGIFYEFIWETIRGRKPSWRDLTANLLGGLCAVIF